MTTSIYTIICISLISIACTAEKPKRDKRFEGLAEHDIHNLAESWDNEDIEDGLVDEEDLPEHRREKRQPDMDVIMKDPKRLDQPTEEDVKFQKKHRTLMMFVDVVEKDFWLAKEEPRTRPWSTRQFAEDISSRWEGQLHNAGEIGIMRFQPDDDQILFKLNDGSRAYAIKNFLAEQEECINVNIEKTSYKGKGHELVGLDQHEAEKKAKKDRNDAVMKKKKEIKERKAEEKEQERAEAIEKKKIEIREREAAKKEKSKTEL